MIFGLFKTLIWLAGVAVLGYFGMQVFGYDINWNYWNESKAACQGQIEECRRDLIRTGIEGARERCDWKCVDPKLLIRKESEPKEATPSSESSDTIEPITE